MTVSLSSLGGFTRPSAAPQVISFTFYSILVPLILLVYATEDLEVAVHHRFMPWWAIVWLPLLVTITTMAFSPNRSAGSWPSTHRPTHAPSSARRHLIRYLIRHLTRHVTASIT